MAETVKDKGWRFSLDTGMSTDGAGSSPAGLILSARATSEYADTVNQNGSQPQSQ